MDSDLLQEPEMEVNSTETSTRQPQPPQNRSENPHLDSESELNSEEVIQQAKLAPSEQVRRLTQIRSMSIEYHDDVTF